MLIIAYPRGYFIYMIVISFDLEIQEIKIVIVKYLT